MQVANGNCTFSRFAIFACPCPRPAIVGSLVQQLADVCTSSANFMLLCILLPTAMDQDRQAILPSANSSLVTESSEVLGSLTHASSHLALIKGEVRTINDRNMCERRSCMKNNGKKSHFQICLWRGEMPVGSSASLSGLAPPWRHTLVSGSHFDPEMTGNSGSGAVRAGKRRA